MDGQAAVLHVHRVAQRLVGTVVQMFLPPMDGLPPEQLMVAQHHQFRVRQDDAAVQRKRLDEDLQILRLRIFGQDFTETGRLAFAAAAGHQFVTASAPTQEAVPQLLPMPQRRAVAHLRQQRRQFFAETHGADAPQRPAKAAFRRRLAWLRDEADRSLRVRKHFRPDISDLFFAVRKQMLLDQIRPAQHEGDVR